MATLSDLEEVKAALDKGLISQAEFDDVKRDYLRAKKEALEFQKKELHAKEEALEANKEFQKRELIAKEAFQQKKSEADLRAYALESIVKHGSSLMSEEQRVDLVRDYAKMSGLDCKPASKRQRPSPPQPATPPARAAIPAPPADPPTPADEDEYSNYSDADGENDSDYDDPRTAKRTSGKKWTEEDDAALVAALRAGQRVAKIRIGGRSDRAAAGRLLTARRNGSGTPALREYLEETCPGYVYNPPSERRVCNPWSAEEDQTFIQAHREGKTFHEIAALLPNRTNVAVEGRWKEAKSQRSGSAALRAYAAECRKGRVEI